MLLDVNYLLRERGFTRMLEEVIATFTDEQIRQILNSILESNKGKTEATGESLVDFVDLITDIIFFEHVNSRNKLNALNDGAQSMPRLIAIISYMKPNNLNFLKDILSKHTLSFHDTFERILCIKSLLGAIENCLKKRAQ